MATVSAAEHGAPPSRPPVARRTRCHASSAVLRVRSFTKSAPASVRGRSRECRACLFLRSRPSRRPRAYDNNTYNRCFSPAGHTRRPPSAFFFFVWRAPYDIIRRRRGVHVRRVFRPVPANLVPRCNGLPVHRRVHHHNDTSARRAAEVRRVAAVRRARPGRRMSGRR